MPIEIRQLVIRSTVPDRPDAAPESDNLAVADAPLLAQLRAELRAELLADCRAMIDDRLQRERER
jgi:hypothetical protein